MTRIAEHPAPNHFLLHLSDTHLIAGDNKLYGDVDAEQRLEQILNELEASRVRPEAIVITGDIADTGEPEAYIKIRRMMDPVAERMGTKIIWAMGNHDNRSAFRKHLLDEPENEETITKVDNLNGLRIITLDTSVPGHHYGEIDDDQLHWLADELRIPAPDGTILALHHPPVPAVLPMAMTVELRGQRRLADVVRGSDIRSIIGGHLHYSSTATFAGIPVSVASSTCYTQDLNVRTGGTYGRDGAQGYNMIHVYPETILHSVVPMGTGALVGKYVSPEEAQVILKAEGIVLPEYNDDWSNDPWNTGNSIRHLPAA